MELSVQMAVEAEQQTRQDDVDGCACTRQAKAVSEGLAAALALRLRTRLPSQRDHFVEKTDLAPL